MITVSRLVFSYPDGRFVLNVPEFRVETGERLAVIGASGAGKSTLLKLIAGILLPDTGTITVDGTPLHQLRPAERRNFRISRVGFVFQELELLEYLNVLDNILLTYRINPVLRLDRGVRDRAVALARETGLEDKLSRLPGELSQGERQRTAVCRALASDPRVLLADEATGNLDPTNKIRIIDLLFRAAERRKASLVAVTHDHELLPRFDRVVDLTNLLG
ncbi:MAG: ATP-binding cassette domain-containing protein [Methylotetracoccus sp.]